MTDKATHTPLPWEAQTLETEHDPGVYIVGSNLGGLVCAALPWPTEIESGDYSRVEANAAFIVHAVNSHHDLIEALREATQIADYLWRKHYRDNAPDWRPLPDLRGVISQIDNMVTGLIKEPTR